MVSLNQGAWVPGTENYQYGHNSIPNIPITGAPADTDWSRWTMFHDGNYYRLIAFLKESNDKLYQFAWNGKSYGYRPVETLALTNAPEDADTGSVSMLHDGKNYCAYLRGRDDQSVLYRFIRVLGTGNYQWAYRDHAHTLRVAGFPADTDWTRWTMLHDGMTYRVYAFHDGRQGGISQGSWNAGASEYQYGFTSIPELIPKDFPADSDFNRAAMLHDGRGYRLYFQAP
jgi:hypothetical protein